MYSLLKSLFILTTFTVLLLAGPAHAQEADTLDVQLPEVVIEAAHETETSATAPFAVSLVARGPTTVALEPALTLDATLRGVPGLWINDRENMALGERITVRGMGWRAPWGVRGVQLVLDGIPLTLPDGQSFPGIIPPSLIRRAELVRGPASRFWGNGSGGVLFLSTVGPEEEPFSRVRALAGSYGERQLLAQAGTSIGSHYVQGYLSDTRQGGYRRHSEGNRMRGGLYGRFELGARSALRLVAAFEGKEAEHPSSLTREQLDRDPRMARPLFVENRAGEESTQGQVGLAFEHDTGPGRLTATAYVLARTLDNPLPFGYVAYERHAGGTRISWQRRHGRLEWGVGADAALQRDDRQNWNTVKGRRGEERQLDQVEDVFEGAVSVFASLDLTRRLQLSAGLRASRLYFASDDQLLTSDDPALEGDQSGSRTFAAWSPSVGLSYRAGPALLFANYNTAFETPTMTELVNRPAATTGGFNPGLQPQTTRGFEVGARGGWPAARLQFDVALFRLHVEDALVQVGTNEKGREFFGNAAASIHQGVEAAATWASHAGTSLRVSYTGGRYVYEDDIIKSTEVLAVDGHRLPGVPDHRLDMRLRQVWGGLRAQVTTEAVSGYHVDDANTDAAKTDGYVVADMLLGHERLAVGSLQVRPFVELGNVFDAGYVGSVVVNAFGGRYYEPAPGRHLTVGVDVAL